MLDHRQSEPAKLESEGYRNGRESDVSNSADDPASPVPLEMVLDEGSASEEVEQDILRNSVDLAASTTTAVDDSPASSQLTARALSWSTWCGMMLHVFLVLVGVAVGFPVQELASAVVSAGAAALRVQEHAVPL